MSTQTVYRCGIALEMQPSLEIIVRFKPEKVRRYDDIELAENEFAADSRDALSFTAYIHRKDRPLDECLEQGEITKFEIQGIGAEEYEVAGSWTRGTRALFEGTVRSKKPLLYTEKSSAHKIRLCVWGRVNPSPADLAKGRTPYEVRPDQSGQARDALEVELKPRLLYVHTFVVPSRLPNHSDAHVYVCLAPEAEKRLKSAKIKIEVKDVNPETGARLILLPREPNHKPDDVPVWALRYDGITWDNALSAQFIIRVGIEGGDAEVTDAVWYCFNVGENMKHMLGAMSGYRAATEKSPENPVLLDLDNQEYDIRGFWQVLWDFKWPKELRGILYDFRNFAGLVNNQYTCGNIRDRIWDWVTARRYSDDVIVRTGMNGIELTKCEMAPLHVFFGFYPSGGDRNDPWFIDPWWRQRFDDGVMCKWFDEELRLGAGFTFLASPVIGVMLVSLGAAATAAEAIALLVKYLKSMAEVGIAAGTGTYIVFTILGVQIKIHIGETELQDEAYLKNSNGQYMEYKKPKDIIENWIKSQKPFPYVMLTEKW